MNSRICRFCSTPLKTTFCNLGLSPIANHFVGPADLGGSETFYPLHAFVCDSCFLVQIEEFEPPEKIFSDYAYFSSYSDSWLAHCKAYADAMIERFSFGPKSLVVEVASNDGYLLRFFKDRRVPVLGVEPAENVARVAMERGIETVVRFFGTSAAKDLAASRGKADLMLGNNVLAHVPDLNDFVSGFPILLAPSGVLTLEFPHLLRLMGENQFDTIYHEHFSYFSFTAVKRVLAKHGLSIFDVDEIPTHGGSLRIYAQHEASGLHPKTERVEALLDKERRAELQHIDAYRGFDERVRETKRALLSFLIEAKRAGKRVAGYGAPAKGNTLLNYCGIGRDFIDFTVDRSPAKQGRFLPGSRIPILAPERLEVERPDYLLILPWNLKDEIVEQTRFIAGWGGKHVVPIPKVQVL